jgi:hypothetical protein
MVDIPTVSITIASARMKKGNGTVLYHSFYATA